MDLLREEYPGLVPVRGGADGGMDGAVADPRGGAPVPLVATTAKSVIGNVTKNLKSYLGAGGAARDVIVATSQPLTARQRRNLERRVDELGFSLRQIHDQADFADRLYRDPAWRKELLALTGAPPALSVFPRSPQPRRASRLLGRDEELVRLRAAEGDVVVSGQPGVGKTALLGALAEEGLGLFAVSRDVVEIANAMRQLRPERVFVDDAHLDDAPSDSAGSRESLISHLCWLRRELDMDFWIVATTWPGWAREIRHVLNLPRGHVLPVGRLDRRIMADIVRQVDPRLTDKLIGEILDQSDGRPGLAVSLARWVRRGELGDLLSGRLLLGEIKRDMRLGDFALDSLAVFALGGNRGMKLAAAARVMEASETELRKVVLRMSGTGVIREAENDRALLVEPAALRHALVRRTYFSGALSKSLDPSVEEVEDAVTCTETLIGVLGRGGRVPHEIVQARLRGHDEAGVGKQLWEDYAWTGMQAARWILSAHPGKSALVADAALQIVPDHALDQLLSAVVRRRGDPDSLVAQIRSWALAGRPGTDVVARRRLLLHELARKTGCTSATVDDGERAVEWHESCAELVQVAFALDFRDIDGDPITKEDFNLTLGSLPASDVRELARLWPSALTILGTLGDSGIAWARRILRGWCTGPRVLNELPETRRAARREAAGMLPGVVELAGGAPGIVLWAHRIARAQGLRADLPPVEDPVLIRLFPVLHKHSPEYRSERRFVSRVEESGRGVVDTARALAEDWATSDPVAAILRILPYERQRQLLDHHYPDILNLIPNLLAQQVDDPSRWLEALVEHDAPAGWVASFLEAAVALDPSNDAPWRIVGCRSRYLSASVQIGLSVAGLSGGAVDRIMAALPAQADPLVSLSWDQLPREWSRRLLRHTDASVRSAAAAGIWESFHRRPAGPLGMLWQAAVVECGDAETLREILPSDGGVASAWVLHKARASAELALNNRTTEPWPNENISTRELAAEIMDGVDALDQLGLDEDLACRACGRLTATERRDLILAIPPDADVMFFRQLVGSDPDLYAFLLRRRVPKEAHLAPLARAASKERRELARLAQEHGYSMCDIESAGFDW